MQIIKTILADSHPIFIEGLKSVLGTSDKYFFDVLYTLGEGEELIRSIKKRQADLLILELNLSEVDGLEILATIQRERLSIRVLVLTTYDDPKIVKSALKYGAKGYILKDKSLNELFFAIDEVLHGHVYIGNGITLAENGRSTAVVGKQQTDFAAEDRFIKKYSLTKRELEILRLISGAMSNKEIAKELYISDQTVSVHRKNIMRKLGVSNTAGLIKVAYDYSLI